MRLLYCHSRVISGDSPYKGVEVELLTYFMCVDSVQKILVLALFFGLLPSEVVAQRMAVGSPNRDATYIWYSRQVYVSTDGAMSWNSQGVALPFSEKFGSL